MFDEPVWRDSKARAEREAADREENRRTAVRYIEAKKPWGEQTPLLLEALGLAGPVRSMRQCPHCGQAPTGGRDSCRKVACLAAIERDRQGLDARLAESFEQPEEESS